MTRDPLPNPPGTLDAGSLTRTQAAQLLKLARQTGGDVVTEAIDWAFAAMPDRPAVQRLKVRSLMRTGELEAADALLAQALLVYPIDPVLSLLRAERLLAKGRLQSAAREVELVLGRQPDRPSALALGAEVAMKQADHRRAVHFLERALQVRPFETAHRMRLVEALLADSRGAQAALQLAHLTNPPALLEARVLRALGRAIDALARLQQEWNHGAKGERADGIAAGIVELLEETGRIDELDRFVTTLGTSHPRALASAAEAWLMLGRFEEAVELGAKLLRRRAFMPTGRGVLLVATTMLGNFGLAQRVVRQLIASERTIDRISLADLWRRGMIGRLIRTHTALMQNAAPTRSGLESLADSATALFREQLVRAEAAGNEHAVTELTHLIRQCTQRPNADRAAPPPIDDPAEMDQPPTRRAA